MTTPTDRATAAADDQVLSASLVDDVLVVTIDVPGRSVNTLGPGMVAEFEELLARIDREASLKGVVLISGKPDGFIAGADIEQFAGIRTASDAEQLSRLGQDLVARLEATRVPVIAAVHGPCLGGGLELALGCRYRICTNDGRTAFGLPEVQLGLIPGMGGTQRLPRVVGLQVALDMILTGRSLRAARALSAGLVDEVVHPAILEEIAITRARSFGTRPRAKNRSRGGATSLLLEKNPIGRLVAFRKARSSILEKTHGHYPAPLAALEAMEIGYRRGLKAGFAAEARRFGRMAVTDESRQLVFLFQARNALRKDPGVPAPAPDPLAVDKIGILGAGFMGAGIASVAVQAGTLVRLKDTDTERLGRGLASVHAVLSERSARRRMTRLEMTNQLVMVGTTTDYSGFASVDLVIEAVFEDLALKRRVLEEVEPAIRDDAVYASNTSTIPIARIAEASKHRERVLGMHFFSPVHRMPLLEVIVTPTTSPQAAVTAAAYGRKLGKTVILVNDGPGFYTTRILSAYLNEAGRLLDEGTAVDRVDDALTRFGFPVGPFTLIDEVGLDVAGKVGLVLAEAFGDRMAPAEAMRRIVIDGRTGRKGRRGLYRYDKSGEKGKVDESIYTLIGSRPGERAPIQDSEVVERCVLAMVNEAVRCLEEGIVRLPRDGDLGAVFGIGFPPFRGGPFRYTDTVGADTVLRRLEELNGRFAPRFEPAEQLVELARARRKFYL